MDLLNLQPHQVSRGLSGKYVLLYGPPKVGKTTMASQFDKALLLAFEQGYNALSGIYAQPVYTWSEMKQIKKDLCSNEQLKEKFHTIIIDTADLAWDACEKYVCGLFDVSDISEVPWGKAHAKLRKEYDATFRDLTRAGYGIVFISHEQEKTVNEVIINDQGKTASKEVKKICPSLGDKPRLVIDKMVDIIAYMKPIKDDKGNIQRFLITRDSLGIEAGSRFKYLPATIPMSYENLVNAVNLAIDKEAAEAGSEVKDGEISNTEALAADDYEGYLNTIRQAWKNLSEEKMVEILSLIEKRLGRKAKVSELTPEDNAILKEIISML